MDNTIIKKKKKFVELIKRINIARRDLEDAISQHSPVEVKRQYRYRHW